jgi:uncharacterized protein (TIGR02453 family)
MPGSLITPQLFRFFTQLRRHNDRDWFNANKQRYLDEVRDPLLTFVEMIGPRLRAVSPEIVADSRPVGGSLFRIYRDTRFSKDKSPYKTHAGIHFRHRAGKDVHAPGFYLHLEPGQVFMAGGIWHPDSPALKAIREAIDEDPAAWKRAKRIGLDDGEALVRVPRGFDPEHPMVEDLKRKSFTASASFTETQACAPDFPARFARACKSRAPLMKFLAEAVDLSF